MVRARDLLPALHFRPERPPSLQRLPVAFGSGGTSLVGKRSINTPWFRISVRETILEQATIIIEELSVIPFRIAEKLI